MGPDKLWMTLLALAVFVSPMWLILKGMQSASREYEAQQKRAKNAATMAAATLGLQLAPCEDPYRRGGWMLSGVLEGTLTKLWFQGTSAVLSLSTEDGTPEPWDLAHSGDFGRGGIENPPDDPYTKLGDEVLGPGADAWVRGERVAALVLSLPENARRALRDDANLSVVDGWYTLTWGADAGLATDRARADALAAWARAQARRLARPSEPEEAPGPAAPDEGTP